MRVIFLGASNPETIRMIRAIERVQPDFNTIGFIDNDLSKKNTEFYGYPVFGGFEMLSELIAPDVYFVNLISGSTRARYETSKHIIDHGGQLTNFIHPSVDLTMTSVGTGVYIQDSVIIQAGCRVGNNSSIHIGSLIGHETTIGDSVFIAHGCSVSGCVQIEDGVFMGTNASVIPRLKIGRWSTVGAGAVVTKNVPEYSVVIGNPARVLKTTTPVHENGDIYSSLSGKEQ